MRRVYQDGDILYAQDVNAIAYPIPDGQDFIGRGPKVADEYLDDAADQIKSRFYNFYDRLKVSHQSGLTFSYLGGVVLLSNGNTVSINPGTIAVPNNSTSFIFVGSNGAVQQSSTLPNECFPLAQVTTASGVLSGDVNDLRDKLIDRVAPGAIPSQVIIPSGSGMEYWGSTLPSGWLWANGSFYDPTAYPALFAAIGYTHGQSGSLFRVPDKRGRVSVGAGQGAGLTNRTLGQSFGEESVTLNTNQIPSHNHGINDPGHSHSVSDPGHGHGVNDPGHFHAAFCNTYDGNSDQRRQTDGFLSKPNVGITGEDTGTKGVITTNASGNQLISSSGTGLSIYGSGTGVSVNGSGTGITTNAQGGGGSHNNIQPSLVCNYIIKI